MNAIVYCRVSTDEQKEHGYGLVPQRRECTEYAERHGMNVVAVFEESHTSTTLDRPKFNKLKQMLEQGLADAVIFHRVDRLSRDHVDLMYIRRKFFDAGIEIHYCDKGKDSPSFAGDTMIFLDGRGGEEDNTKRTKATKQGRFDKAESGRHVCSGPPPYGYQYEYSSPAKGMKPKAELQVNQPEAAVVRKIFELYVHGNGTGRPLSLEGVCRELNRGDDPLLPPGRKKSCVGYWQPTTVRRILKNELYAGRAYYHKTEVIKNGRGERVRVHVPREEWIPIDLEPELALVDRRLWKAAQKRIKTNQMNRRYDYLLTGFLRCALCGSAVGGHTKRVEKKSGGTYIYTSYRCGSKQRPGDAGYCLNKKRRVRDTLIEPVVWDWVTRLLLDEPYRDRALDAMIKRHQEQAAPLRERLEYVLDEIADLDAQLSRLTLQWAGDDKMVQAVFQREASRLADERRLMDAERQRIEAELENGGMTEALKAQIQKLAKKISGGVDRVRNSTRRYIFDRLNVVVYLHRDEDNIWLEMTCGMPESSEVVSLTPSSWVPEATASGTTSGLACR